jgi:hypothetical protein
MHPRSPQHPLHTNLSPDQAYTMTVTDCSAGRSSEQYRPDSPVCLVSSVPIEVNALVMWCGLSYVYYEGLPINSGLQLSLLVELCYTHLPPSIGLWLPLCDTSPSGPTHIPSAKYLVDTVEHSNSCQNNWTDHTTTSDHHD